MKTYVVTKEKPDLKETILIEGLPGVGLVGKVAVDYMVSELGAKKFAELYSPYIPHQAMVRKNSEIELIRNEFYYFKGKKDIIFFAGEAQAVETFGHYEIVSEVLDYVAEYDTQLIYTLGGFATRKGGKRVFGAVTDSEMTKKYENHDIIFMNEGSIVGTAGLLLGMGKLRGIQGACFLGECSGHLVAPKAAKSVLKVIADVLDIQLDFGKLDQRIEKTEEFLENIKHLEGKTEGGMEEGYIG